MLRRRFLATIKLLRVYIDAIVTTYNKVRAAASSLSATLAKFTSGPVVANKLDSSNYDANTVEADVMVGIQPNIAPDPFDASVAGNNSNVAMYTSTEALAVSAKCAIAQKEVVNNTCSDAQNCGAATGDVQKIIRIDSLANAVDADSMCAESKKIQQIINRTEPLSGDSKLTCLSVSTCDKPSMSAVASEKIYSQIEANEGVEKYVAPDVAESTDALVETGATAGVSIATSMAESSLSLLNADEISVNACIKPEKFNIMKANSNTQGSMIVVFAPTAKVVSWLDPILTDGALLIRQAYGINQNNNTLEVT